MQTRPDRKRVARAQYEAARSGRHYDSYYGTAYSTSANAELSLSIRKTLRNRCRMELRNNSWARGMVDAKANYVVGTGPRLQLLRSGGEPVSDKISNRVERLWERWTIDVAYGEMLRAALVQRYGETGEAFSILTSSGSGNITLLPVLIEADRVTDPIGEANTSQHEDGIDYDDIGRPTRYRVLTDHPGDTWGGSARFNVYPASSVHHIYRPIRPGQRRGVADIVPALPAFGYLRSYNMAVLASAEAGAKMTFVLYSTGQNWEGAGGDLQPADVDPFESYELERGMATTMPYGWDIKGFDPKQPGGSHVELVKLVVGECGRCLQMPWSVAIGTSQDMNYASGRLDSQAFIREVEIERNRIEVQEIRPTALAWLKEAALAYPDLRSIDPYDVDIDFYWPGFYHVDPVKEAQAQEIRLRNMTTTLADEWGARGDDWVKKLDQIAAEKKAIDARGLRPSPPTAMGVDTDASNNETETEDGEDTEAEELTDDQDDVSGD